jgi:WS/DGAT/MGAT family acyltransferase
VTDERLSALDTAFLCLESPDAPMHLGALAVFQPSEPVPADRLVAVLGDRAERLALLRRRVRPAWPGTGSDSWTEDRLFHVRRHIRVHQVAEEPTGGLAALAGEVMAQPLDLTRPLWQLHIFTGLPGDRFAVLVKLHHALADGLRAVQLGMGLLDGLVDSAPSVTGSGPDRPAGAPQASMLGRVRSAAELAARPDRLAGWLIDAANGLGEVARQMVDTAGIASSVLSGARLGAPESPLAANSTMDRRADRRADRADGGADRGLVLLRLDVGDIRRVRRRFGGTDNDVLLAVLTGALRSWLVERGDRVDGPAPRALIPVSRRSRPGDPVAGNMLSGYLCELPVQERDPLSQLDRIRATMDRNKAAGPARGAGAIPLLANRVPAMVHRMATPLARRGAGLLFDTVVTNVPVPALPLALDGAALTEVYPIAPLAYGQALGVALSTYRGTVHVGLHANRQALPDLHRLADAVPEALATLGASAAIA